MVFPYLTLFSETTLQTLVGSGLRVHPLQTVNHALVNPQVYKLHITGRGGYDKKNDTLAKFGQKAGTFTHIQPYFACFTYIFYILTYLHMF